MKALIFVNAPPAAILLLQEKYIYSAPSEIVNLGRVKAPVIGDRKRVRSALIRTRLRSLRASILGSFHAGPNSQFLTARSIADYPGRGVSCLAATPLFE